MYLDLPSTKLQAKGGKVEETVKHGSSTSHPKVDNKAIPKAVVSLNLVLQIIHPEVLRKHGEEASAGVVCRSLLPVPKDYLLTKAMLVLIQHIISCRQALRKFLKIAKIKNENEQISNYFT